MADIILYNVTDYGNDVRLYDPTVVYIPPSSGQTNHLRTLLLKVG